MVRRPIQGVKALLVNGRRADTITEMANHIREPVVAGAFYPGGAHELRSTVASLIGEEFVPNDTPLPTAIGLIVPHAGYPYSGGVAAAGFRAAAASGRPEIAVILGANHSGWGSPVSLDTHEAWRTPLGEVPVALDTVRELQEAGLATDDSAFLREHSLEVQLPFVQVLWGDSVPIVPICVQFAAPKTLIEAGHVLARVTSERPVLVVASSDFTHYEPDETARRLDRAALDRILDFDVEGFVRQCRAERLSICGAGAITVLMTYAVERGATRSRLLTYATSGDASGDRSAVVGYASVLFDRRSDDS